MKHLIAGMVCCLLALSGQGQSNSIAFISDTQAPMAVEKLWLKSHHNEKATALLFKEIVATKPSQLFILGDVVSLGYKKKKWAAMDTYLKQCRDAGIPVSALLGNHDVMTKATRGERIFQQHFPNHVRTGYYLIVDSLAVVLLNSNFSKMGADAIAQEESWLRATLVHLDTQPSVKAVVVTCHHAPYTNSTIVKPNTQVQEKFVSTFNQSRKGVLFITGHAHAFEHFRLNGKNFLTIGGGGGLHQPLRTGLGQREDFAATYKPLFHYLTIDRQGTLLRVTSRYLSENFDAVKPGYSISIAVP
ncbi:MAG TPA: metallophosphoesterase [Cyclobacteriaceae bacterium]|nr:metallophosphoesterase [Cyclobacteriaceae bacterium]